MDGILHESQVACDAGRSFIKVSKDGKYFYTLAESGDFEGVIEGKAAEVLLEYIENSIEPAISDYNP